MVIVNGFNGIKSVIPVWTKYPRNTIQNINEASGDHPTFLKWNFFMCFKTLVSRAKGLGAADLVCAKKFLAQVIGKTGQFSRFSQLLSWGKKVQPRGPRR